MSKWGSWHTGYQPRFFQVNNEYLNYFADEETGPLLGSYNLKKLERVEVDSKGLLILSFNGKHNVWLRAPNSKEAQLWATCLEDRRRWFDDIVTAAESAKKKASREAASRPSPITTIFPPKPKIEVKKQDAKKFQLQIAVLCVLCIFLGMFLGKFLT
jgi:hypothetical protein